MDNIKTGALMRERRKEKGLTQREVAELLHVSQNTYSQYEIGTNRFPLELAERLHVTDRAVSKWERGVSRS